MNNDFNYQNNQSYDNPFTNTPQYDFYDELVVKDAKRATSRSLLSLVLYTVAAYVLIYAIDLILGLVMVYGLDNRALYETVTGSVYYKWISSTLPMYIAGTPVVYLMLRKIPKRQAPLEKPKMSFAQFIMMIPIAEAAMMVGGYIGSFISSVYSAILGVENYDAISDMISETPMWLIFVLTVVLAPIAEEFIFRKLLLDRLSVYGSKYAIMITAVAFGLFHGNLGQFFYATLVGIVLGYVALKSGSWLYSVILHMIMNFLGSIVPLLVSDSLERYMELAEKMLEDPTAYSTIPSEYLGDIMVSMLYSGLVSTLVIGGIVLFVLGIRKKWFKLDDRLSIRIPRQRTAGVIFKNVGSILFLVLAGILITFDLIYPLIQTAAA